jgi:cell division protein FtsB
VAQTIGGGNEQLVVRVRDLERRNKALDAKVTELHRQVHELEATAHP